MTGTRRAFLLAGLVTCAMAAARAEESVVDVPTPKNDLFHIDRPDVVVELLGRYNDSSIKPNGPSLLGPPVETRGRDTTLQTTLGLSTHGDIGGPEIFSFDVGGRFSLQQMWQKMEDQHDNDFSMPYEYNFAGTLLRSSSAPLSLQASRTIEFTSQPFSETYQQITNTYEAVWNIKSDLLPTEFRLFHNDIRQDSLTGVDDFKSEQNGVQWQTEARFSPTNRLFWNYSFNSVSQTDGLGQSSSYDANAATLVHQYDFGPRNQSRLTSTLDYLDQVGDFAQEHFRLDENLLLRHNDQFETFYEYQFEQTRYPQVDTTLNRLKAGFRDKIFDNLRMTGDVGGLMMDQSGAGTDELFAHLDFDYSRKVSFGLLSASLQLGVDQQNNEAQNTEAHVVEMATFDASQQIVIPQRGIQANSIGVRSGSGTRTFFMGIDYLTTYRANRAIVQRIPGGAIGAGKPVMIDYDVIPMPAHDMFTDNVNIGLRYDIKEGLLKGLGAYVRYSFQNQEISSDQPGAFVPDNLDAIVVGAEYRIWRLRFSAEHEDHHSDLVPFQSNRFSARYEDRIARDWRVVAEATRVYTLYEDDNSNPIATTAAGSIEYHPSRNLTVGGTIGYLKLEDDLSGGAEGLEEQLDLRWTHRDTTFKWMVRHTKLQTDPQDSSSLFFQFSVERRF